MSRCTHENTFRRQQRHHNPHCPAIAGEAIAGYVERELEIVAGIERGLEDVKAGRVVSRDAAMADIDARIKRARAKAGRRKR